MNLINFDFEISLPIDRWEHTYEKTWKTPFKNKFFEVNVYKTNAVLGFSTHWSIKEDHPGFALEFIALGFAFAFVLYDCRHWDYEKCKWEEQ